MKLIPVFILKFHSCVLVDGNLSYTAALLLGQNLVLVSKIPVISLIKAFVTGDGGKGAMGIQACCSLPKMQKHLLES